MGPHGSLCERLQSEYMGHSAQKKENRHYSWRGGGRNLGAHRLMLEPHFFADGPRWAAQPPSARPRCQVTKPRGWERASLAAPVGGGGPFTWGGCLNCPFPAPLSPGGPPSSRAGASGSPPVLPLLQKRHVSSWPGRHWRSWTGVSNSWRPCRPTAP